MNKALVELVRKYEKRVARVQAHSFKAVTFYSDAAVAVLKLAKQQRGN